MLAYPDKSKNRINHKHIETLCSRIAKMRLNMMLVANLLILMEAHSDNQDIVRPMAILRKINTYYKPGEDKAFKTKISYSFVEPAIDKTIGLLTKLKDKSTKMKSHVQKEQLQVKDNEIQEGELIYTIIKNQIPTFLTSECTNVDPTAKPVQPTNTEEFENIIRIMKSHNTYNPDDKITAIYLLAKTRSLEEENDELDNILVYPNQDAITTNINETVLTEAKEQYPRLNIKGNIEVKSNKLKLHGICKRRQNWRKINAGNIDDILKLVQITTNRNIEKLKQTKSRWNQIINNLEQTITEAKNEDTKEIIKEFKPEDYSNILSKIPPKGFTQIQLDNLDALNQKLDRRSETLIETLEDTHDHITKIHKSNIIKNLKKSDIVNEQENNQIALNNIQKIYSSPTKIDKNQQIITIETNINLPKENEQVTLYKVETLNVKVSNKQWKLNIKQDALVIKGNGLCNIITPAELLECGPLTKEDNCPLLKSHETEACCLSLFESDSTLKAARACKISRNQEETSVIPIKSNYGNRLIKADNKQIITFKCNYKTAMDETIQKEISEVSIIKTDCDIKLGGTSVKGKTTDKKYPSAGPNIQTIREIFPSELKEIMNIIEETNNEEIVNSIISTNENITESDWEVFIKNIEEMFMALTEIITELILATILIGIAVYLIKQKLKKKIEQYPFFTPSAPPQPNNILRNINNNK